MKHKIPPPKMPKGRGRRQEFFVTEEMFGEIESMSGRGLTIDQMAGFYGVCQHTLIKRMDEVPELRAAYRRGKSKQIIRIAGKLIESANSGNLQAIIFYLRTQAGWTEKDIGKDIEQEQAKKEPDVTINVSDPIEAVKIYQQFMRGKAS